MLTMAKVDTLCRQLYNFKLTGHGNFKSNLKITKGYLVQDF